MTPVFGAAFDQNSSWHYPNRSRTLRARIVPSVEVRDSIDGQEFLRRTLVRGWASWFKEWKQASHGTSGRLPNVSFAALLAIPSAPELR